MKNEQLEALMKNFNQNPPLTKKMKNKKESLLLKIPLFTIIYQKKGDQNFDLIVNNIKLIKAEFGQVILNNNKNQRTFNYLVKGAVMLFTVNQQDIYCQYPKYYKRINAKQYFGQKISFGNDILYEAKCVTTSYVLQLDLQTFYNAFSGHFQYAQLRDKVTFLQKIWLFQKMNRFTLQKILLMSQTVKFSKNTILFKQNQLSNLIYIIIDGQLTLYTEQKKQKVKHLPFCILSRSQICGLEQLIMQQPFTYNGVVTTQFLEVSILKPDVLNIIKNFFPNKQEFLSNCKNLKDILKDHSIKYDKKYRTLIDRNLQQKRQKSQQKRNKLLEQSRRSQKLYIQNVQLNHVQKLKKPIMRYITLNQIKQQQSKIFQSSLSTLTNNSYTKDKKLLINYLTKKENRMKKASMCQLRYAQSVQKNQGLLKKIYVDKSNAVKQHKRKLIKSRFLYRSTGSLDL